MNDPQALPDEASAPVDPAADAAPAPKRRRAPRAAAAEAVASDAPVTLDESAKPAVKRRTRKVAADVAAVEEALPVEPPSDAEPSPAPRARRPRKAAAPVASEAASNEPAVDAPAEGSKALPVVEAVVVDERPSIRAERDEERDEEQDDDAAETDVESVGDGVPVPVASVAQRFEDVVSGEYDVQSDASAEDEAEAGKRVLRPEPEAPKLHKVLAQAGIGSRRDMEQLIADGEVTVNGEVAHQGMRITYGDQIRVSGKPVKVRIQGAPSRVLAYHKPVGEVVTHNDPDGRPTVFRRLPRLPQGKWLSVGRLDLNTEGLLLFTNSGDLAHQLMHPRFGIEREYAVRVLGDLTEELRSQLLEGVEIEGQKAAFKSIEDGGGEGANHWWRVVITEGRNREVRRLFDAVGLTVSRLIRIRYGSVVLPRGLKRGVWVELDDHDVRLIRQLAGAERRGQGQGGAQRPQGQPGQQGQGQGPQGQGQGQGKRGKNRRQGGGAPQFGQGSNFGGGQQGAPGGQGGGQGPQQGRRNGPNPPQGQPQRPPKAPRVARDDMEPDSDGPMYIPNPLEQTFDRRFATGSKRISSGFGRPSDDPYGQRPQQKKGGPREPDPMQTSVGYIGADAYFRKPGGGGGGGGGGGSGGGGGGGQRRRGRR